MDRYVPNMKATGKKWKIKMGGANSLIEVMK